jgi:hypothetical protein
MAAGRRKILQAETAWFAWRSCELLCVAVASPLRNRSTRRMFMNWFFREASPVSNALLRLMVSWPDRAPASSGNSAVVEHAGTRSAWFACIDWTIVDRAPQS